MVEMVEMVVLRAVLLKLFMVGATGLRGSLASQVITAKGGSSVLHFHRHGHREVICIKRIITAIEEMSDWFHYIMCSPGHEHTVDSMLHQDFPPFLKEIPQNLREFFFVSQVR